MFGEFKREKAAKGKTLHNTRLIELKVIDILIYDTRGAYDECDTVKFLVLRWCFKLDEVFIDDSNKLMKIEFPCYFTSESLFDVLHTHPTPSPPHPLPTSAFMNYFSAFYGSSSSQ